MEFVATLFSSAGVAFSLLSIFWVYRCSGAINSAFGIFAVAIFGFALWQWVDHCVYPPTLAHETGVAAFIILSSAMNNFYAQCILRGRCFHFERRRKQDEYNGADRRKTPHIY